MPRVCTWSECKHTATAYQVASDGEVWADLCSGHAHALEVYFTKDPHTVLRAWVDAVGGPAAAAAQMTGILSADYLARHDDRYDA